MRTIGAGPAALLAATLAGPAAPVAAAADHAYPLDVENAARWAVLDGLPERASGARWPVRVADLRRRDLATGDVAISAVCGTLDFDDADDGLARFVVFYARDDGGRVVPVGRPFLYGTLSAPNADPRHVAAQAVCGGGEGPRPTVEASR